MAGKVTKNPPNALVKENLASMLKEAIMSGRLVPGQRVVEGKWANEFGAAQTSVREGINLLITEGFLVKDSGRSARVVTYSEQDVARIYAVREVLEGMAARLAAISGADLSRAEDALRRIQQATESGDMRTLIGSDFDFHIAIAEASGNPVLVESLRRMLTPLFAFILIRVLESSQGPEPWVFDLPRHQSILDVIQERNGPLAEHWTRFAVSRFAASAYSVWENVGGSLEAHAKGERRVRTRRRPPKDE